MPITLPDLPLPAGEPPPATLAGLNAAMLAEAAPSPGLGKFVPGEGPIGAAIAFVGEQPGDQEDIEGKPFVGPAGALFSRALREIGIDRQQVYVTNAVKRFKYELRGKRRIHQKPTAAEVTRYRWWLETELGFVHPKLVVALGATAALALNGKPVSVMAARGTAQFGAFPGYVTVHPSYLLRIPDEAAKRAAFKDFGNDLRRIKELVS